jgi:prevent-host-death family protein
MKRNPMMKTVDVHEAKTTLSQLIEAVAAGEEVVIARAGKPVARLVPFRQQGPIRLGVLKGRIPTRLLEDVAKPFSDDQLQQLFGGSLEQ